MHMLSFTAEYTANMKIIRSKTMQLVEKSYSIDVVVISHDINIPNITLLS